MSHEYVGTYASDRDDRLTSCDVLGRVRVVGVFRVIRFERVPGQLDAVVEEDHRFPRRILYRDFEIAW